MALADNRSVDAYMQNAASSIPHAQRGMRARTVTVTATATATAIVATTATKILALPQQRGCMRSRQSAPRKS